MRNSNGEQSAILAEKRIAALDIPGESRERCRELILATRAHMQGVDADTNFIIGADLSIVGKDWDMYWTIHKASERNTRFFPISFISAAFACHPPMVYNGLACRINLRYIFGLMTSS